MALASGRQFLNRQLSPDRCLYFDAENSDADSIPYQKRIWLGLGSPELTLLDSNLFIYQFDRTARYEAQMTEAAKQINPQLIIIDTANTACSIDNENDNAVASNVIAALKRVRLSSNRNDCTMLVLKHAKLSHDVTNKRTHRDIRGSKTWKGELDGIIIHTAGRGRPAHGRYRETYLWPTKSRAFGLTQAIVIKPVALGEGLRFDASFVVDSTRTEHD